MQVIFSIEGNLMSDEMTQGDDMIQILIFGFHSGFNWGLLIVFNTI
jgi:hypothetical protein